MEKDEAKGIPQESVSKVASKELWERYSAVTHKEPDTDGEASPLYYERDPEIWLDPDREVMPSKEDGDGVTPAKEARERKSLPVPDVREVQRKKTGQKIPAKKKDAHGSRCLDRAGPEGPGIFCTGRSASG